MGEMGDSGEHVLTILRTAGEYRKVVFFIFPQLFQSIVDWLGSPKRKLIFAFLLAILVFFNSIISLREGECFSCSWGLLNSCYF